MSVKKEKKERERERQRDGHGRGRGRPEVIQSHSIFEQGPAEMMKKKGNGRCPPSPGRWWWSGVCPRLRAHPRAAPLSPAGSWDKTVDMSDFGPSHIINIKKEKRETDEETKQILRMLQKDDVSGAGRGGFGAAGPARSVPALVPALVARSFSTIRG